jgi:hypothetical protein
VTVEKAKEEEEAGAAAMAETGAETTEEAEAAAEVSQPMLNKSTNNLLSKQGRITTRNKRRHSTTNMAIFHQKNIISPQKTAQEDGKEEENEGITKGK